MLNLFISCTKQITRTVMGALVIVAAAMMLTGCPPNKEAKKQRAGATNIPANIDSTTLINHLEYLSSAVMQGRETATPGNQLAREYIIKIFDSLKIDKAGDSRLQSFPFGVNNQQGANIIGVIKGYQ